MCRRLWCLVSFTDRDSADREQAKRSERARSRQARQCEYMGMDRPHVASWGFRLLCRSCRDARVELLGSLLLYIGIFIAGALILSFWVIPSVVASLVPISYRPLLKELNSALVIAVVTSLPVTAVPLIVQMTERLAARCHVKDADREEIISTSMAVSYPFAQLGNLFVFFFMVFASFYFHTALQGGEWIFLTLPHASVDSRDARLHRRCGRVPCGLASSARGRPASLRRDDDGDPLSAGPGLDNGPRLHHHRGPAVVLRCCEGAAAQAGDIGGHRCAAARRAEPWEAGPPRSF